MKVYLFISLYCFTIPALGQNILFDPGQHLFDSLKKTHSTFWIYEISNIAGSISLDTCPPDYYIAYAFIDNGTKIISKSFCSTTITEGKKAPFEYFIKHKNTIIQEKIKNDEIRTHETTKKIIFFSNESTNKFYIPKNALRIRNKYFKHNSKLKIVSFIRSLDELISDINIS